MGGRESQNSLDKKYIAAEKKYPGKKQDYAKYVSPRRLYSN